MAGGCALSGGCPTDFAAFAIASAVLALLIFRALFPFIYRKGKRTGVWLVIVQIIGSTDLLLSLVMSMNFLKLKLGHPWKSCYLWAVWAEGPFGFGLLISCRIVQGFQLYHVFVKHRLPPIRPSIILVVILLPWICGAAGFWIVAYVLNEIHEDIAWIQVFSRFSLLVMASILVLLFFSMSISQPLHSQISLGKQESTAFMTMGEALGITDRGSVKKINATHFDSNQPLDKLLEDKRFRMSFMSFADSCLAGESVHFYEEVYDLKKIHLDDSIRRIYMARHIIEKYIDAGAEMEINISHRTRQEILGTPDLTHPNLFDSAVSEILQLIKMNLAKDYWSSLQFAKLKEDIERGPNGPELMPLDYSPRVTFVRCTDDPFYEEHAATCN
nr:regulator of G-protein signaling 1 isoform X2 [Setaria viridis]